MDRNRRMIDHDHSMTARTTIRGATLSRFVGEEFRGILWLEFGVVQR